MAYNHGLSLGALCLLLRFYGYGGFEISLTPVFLGQPSLSVVGWWLFIGVCQDAPSSMMQELYPYQTFEMLEPSSDSILEHDVDVVLKNRLPSRFRNAGEQEHNMY